MVRFAALSILAQREHSQHELRQKLSHRFGNSPFIDTVIQHLSAEALQSDQRFTEAFVAYRMRRGQGPLRIANELKLRGITSELIDEHLAVVDFETWLALAEDVVGRKYTDLATERNARAKQMRFLQYRGFSSEIIQRLWRSK
jgi:regulatory protein